MDHFAVTAVGADRPGIVAAVSKAFVEQGCNIEDSAMTILRGQFAMMLIVAAPPGVSATRLKEALQTPAGALGLTLTVEPVLGTEQSQRPGAASSTCTVSVHGADHPGIVHGIADLLAGAGVNIIDLTTRVIGGADNTPVYVMILEVALPPTIDADDLRGRLEEVAAELGVSAHLHPSEADIL